MRPRQKRFALISGGGMALAGAATSTAVITTGNTALGLSVYGLTILASLLVALTSFRTAIILVAIVLVPPGVLGESNLYLAVVGVALLMLVALSHPRTASATFGHKFLLLSVFILTAAGMAVLHIPQYVLLYCFMGFIAVLASERPAFFESICLAIAILLIALVVSYALTLLTNFVRIGTLDFGRRVLEIYFPLTPATGGPPIFAGTRRLAPLTGEPGLTVFYLIPLLAFAASERQSRKSRGAIFAIVLAVSVFSQSLATLLAIGFACFIYLASVLARSKRFLSATVAALVSIALGVPAVGGALAAKEDAAAGSVADRAVGEGGNALGNINLIVAWVNTPALAAFLSAALAALLLLSARSLAGLVAWVAFAITAVSAQPSQWELGAWLLIACATSYSTLRSADSKLQARELRAISLSPSRAPTGTYERTLEAPTRPNPARL